MEQKIKNWNDGGVEYFTEEELNKIESQQNDNKKENNVGCV
jgi:hypothetical protein